MKKFSLLLLGCVQVIQLFCQGTFKATNGITLKTSSGVNLVLNDMHLINNGTLQQSISDGIITFTGSANVNLSGAGITTIDRLLLAKTSGSELKLQTNINIASEINFQSGLMNLDQWGVYLGFTGMLANESENSRAYTVGHGIIQALGILNSPFSVNLGNLGAVISSIKNLGATSIVRGHEVQSNVYGSNNSIRRYYQISPANNTGLKATLRFYYFDAELNGINETTLIQWQKKNPNTWNYVGADSKDPIANFIEQKNISKFDRWTLAKDTVTTMNRLYTNPQPKINKIEFTITAMPNPAINSFFVIVKSGSDAEKITLNTFDISGKLIEVKSDIISGEVFTIGTNYQPGAYLLEVIQGNTRKMVKLLKL